MTRGFWKDPDRYLQTYWARWPDVGVHGDWAAVDSDGQWYVLSRSDDTIKVAGKRLGPAEVESILVEHPDVVEAAAICIPHEIKGSEVVLFCVLQPQTAPSPELQSELKEMVAQAMGKLLTPRSVLCERFAQNAQRQGNAAHGPCRVPGCSSRRPERPREPGGSRRCPAPELTRPARRALSPRPKPRPSDSSGERIHPQSEGLAVGQC